MKRRQVNSHPRSQRDAIRLCLNHAREKHNRSVARIADLVGTTEWAVYKWLAKGAMPSDKIRPFEFACGVHHLTTYLTSGAHKLLIDIPSGRPATEDSLLELHTGFSEAVELLARFYRGQADNDDTLYALGGVLAQLAGHRENVLKHGAPELELFEEDEA